jgi:hypothetical protein
MSSFQKRVEAAVGRVVPPGCDGDWIVSIYTMEHGRRLFDDRRLYATFADAQTGYAALVREHGAGLIDLPRKIEGEH